MAIFTFGLLGNRERLPDLGLRPLAALLVVHVLVDHAGDEQHGARPDGLGVRDGAEKRFQPLGTNRLVGVRQRVAPVDRVDDAVNLDAGRLLCLVRFLEIEAGGAIDLDALEADLLDQLELVLDGLTRTDHAVLDGEVQFGLGGLLGKQVAGEEGGGGSGEEGSAVHGSDVGC